MKIAFWDRSEQCKTSINCNKIFLKRSALEIMLKFQHFIYFWQNKVEQPKIESIAHWCEISFFELRKYVKKIVFLLVLCINLHIISWKFSSLYWNMHTHYAIDTHSCSRKESDFYLKQGKEQKGPMCTVYPKHDFSKRIFD